MSLIWYLVAVIPIAASSIVLGYVIGKANGGSLGYQLGYHEGGFDAVHMPDVFERDDSNP